MKYENMDQEKYRVQRVSESDHSGHNPFSGRDIKVTIFLSNPMTSAHPYLANWPTLHTNKCVRTGWHEG